jgi:hypothetical protein
MGVLRYLDSLSAEEELTVLAWKMYSMEEEWLWYLSGAVDTKARISFLVQKNNQRKLGYYFTPQVVFRISQPNEQDSLLAVLDEYCQDHKVKYRIQDVPSSDTEKFVIENSKNIKRFLEPIMGGFIQQKERAEIMVDELIPLFEDGPPENKEEVVKMMKIADRLRDKPIKEKQSSKYTSGYFIDEWGIRAEQLF